MDGYVGVDINKTPVVDQIVDLNKIPWPWADSSVDEIYSRDCFEHLYPLGKAEGQMNIVAIMKETYRVLKHGGKLWLIVPSTDGRGAWQDPTHVTYWNTNTFFYYVPSLPHCELYDFGPKFSFDEDGSQMRQTKPDITNAVWVEFIARAIK